MATEIQTPKPAVRIDPNKVTLSFVPSKDCKHSRQFKAVVPPGETPVLDGIYVQNSFSAGVTGLVITIQRPPR